MKKACILTFCGMLGMAANAQTFDEYFEDKTLRIDYIFTGDTHKQEVYLD